MARAYADASLFYRVVLEIVYENGEGRLEFYGPYTKRGIAKGQATRLEKSYSRFNEVFRERQVNVWIENCSPRWEISYDDNIA